MATETAQSAFICVVCDEAASFTMSSECNWCDGRYHLNQRNDIESKDCGAVWIDEQYLALQFACNNCLAANGLVPPTTPRAEHSDEPPATRRRYRRRE